MRGPLGGSQGSTKMSRRAIAVLGISAVVAGLIVASRPVLVRWEANRTAQRLVQVLHTRDTAAFALLSGRGSSQTFRCIQQFWPEEFWSLNGAAPHLAKISAPPGEIGYRMLGDSLGGIGAPAILDFYILKDRPKKVERIFVDSRLGVWTPATYECLGVRAA
jgi:hypothetical protein